MLGRSPFDNFAVANGMLLYLAISAGENTGWLGKMQFVLKHSQPPMKLVLNGTSVCSKPL